MRRLTFFYQTARKKPVVSIGVILAIVFFAWLFFFRSTDGKLETLVVQRGDFVQQVSVSGTVKAAQDVDLGFAQSGRVSGAYAKVGDHVGTGALIAEIENGDLRASIAQKEAALASAQAKLASLEAGTRPETIAVTQSEIASDEVALAQADQALANSIKSAFTVGDGVVRNTLDEFISNPRSSSPQISFFVSDLKYEIAVEAGRVKAEGYLTAWQDELDTLTPDNAAAHVAKAQENLAAITTLSSASNAALNRAINSSSVSQSDINGWVADIAAARTELDTAVAALTTAQTSRASAVSALDTDKKTLALQEAGSTSQDIEAQKAQVASAGAELASARAQLRKTLVTAPFDGVVTKMDATVGETVSPGVSAISMISSGIFQIECFVPEINVALVKSGDTADVTLDAYGETLFKARVASIDLAETVRDGVSTYRAILQFTDRDERIRSGMTANVRILTEKKENVISIPRRIVVERDGKKYVSVQTGEDEIVEKEVTTGSVSSSGAIEILTGLNEGDIVVLSQ